MKMKLKSKWIAPTLTVLGLAVMASCGSGDSGNNPPQLVENPPPPGGKDAVAPVPVDPNPSIPHSPGLPGNPPSDPIDRPVNFVCQLDLVNRPEGRTIPGSYIPFNAESRRAFDDIAEIEARNPDQVEQVRYVSLAHLDLQNYSDVDEFCLFKMVMVNSVSGIFNHLSLEPSLARPAQVDRSYSLLRINLDDYGWSADDWEDLFVVNGQNVYPYNRDFDPTFEALGDRLGTAVPIARADWVLSEASLPGQYHQLMDIPNTLAQLENDLNLDIEDNIRRTIQEPDRPQVARAGYRAGASGVSFSNRMIERHPLDFNRYFWLSYDFEKDRDDDASSIFSSPIGPGQDTLDFVDGDNNDQVAFESDGGEIIFTLPNGLQGYMLIDGAGNRLNAGPTTVVIDRSRVGDGDFEIVNGRSCMSCHGLGIIVKNDQVRSHLEEFSDPDVINNDVLEAALRLIPEQAVMDEYFSNDNDLFQRQLRKTMLFTDLNLGNLDRAFVYYDTRITYSMIASELGLTVNQLERQSSVLTEDLKAILAEANLGGASNLEREKFEEAYQRFIEQIYNF